MIPQSHHVNLTLLKVLKNTSSVNDFKIRHSLNFTYDVICLSIQDRTVQNKIITFKPLNVARRI